MTLSKYGRTFKLDGKMDLVLDGVNRFEMVELNEKIKQDMQVLFRTHLGDNIFHTDMGLDFEAISFNYAERVIKDEFTRTIQQYRFVKDILLIDVQTEYLDGVTKTINVSLRIEFYDEEEMTLYVVV